MRSFSPHISTLFIVLLGTTIVGCQCSPPNPVPITMKVINGTKDPFYIDATNSKLGLTVQREVNGQSYGFDDQACECRFCTNACNLTCTCPDAGASLVQRIEPGGSAQRDWDGVVQVSGSTSCGDGTCLTQQNAPLNERFIAELCYSTQKPSGTFNDAGIAHTQLVASSKTCITKPFAIQDGVVEIGPLPGASCINASDCKGTGELCFNGTCTSGCPANDFPINADWVLFVASPDNMGFFTQSPRTTGRQFVGSGTITSVVYAGSSLEVSLSRAGLPNETLSGKLTVQLPPGVGAPLKTATPVTVTVVDDGSSVPNRAVVIRHTTTGTVLFAADMAQGGALLTTTDLAPFTTSSSSAPIGCKQDDCGKFLYSSRVVTSGSTSVTLEPGTPRTLTVGDATYSFLSISNGTYPTTRCDVSELRPWVMWQQ